MRDARRHSRAVGLALLLILAATAARNGWVLARRSAHEAKHELHLTSAPSSLHARFKGARYSNVSKRFAFYAYAQRYRGVRLLAPSSFAEGHADMLLRVAGIETVVDEVATSRRLGDAAISGEPDFEGQIQDRAVYFWHRSGARDYVIIDAGSPRPLYWLPLVMTEVAE